MCDHADDKIRWEPIEIEYGPAQGAVAVWQEGFCACGALVQRDFEPGPSRVMNAPVEEPEEQ